MLSTARSTVAAVSAAAMLASTSLAVVPAAQASEQATYNGVPVVKVGNNNWNKKGNWNKQWKYSNKHHHHRNNGSNLGIGILGFAAGALIGSALTQPHYYGTNIDAYCAQKYKTYKPWTGTYTGYDHREHPCRYP